MSESNDMANLETPITGEIPDDALAGAQVPGDGGSGPSTEAQIISDADLTDVPDADLTDIPEGDPDAYGMHEVEQDQE